MRIAVDAMGGDYAPDELVKGSALAAQEGIEVILVGNTEQLEPLWDEVGRLPQLTIHHAPEVITMDDHPVEAVRKKRQSSLVQTIELVKKGQAGGAVSAGNTGATMAAALLLLGRLPGVLRPAIGSPMPTRKGMSIILDAGANVDCRPQHLAQFAIMGSLYASTVLGISSPKVALLNIGEEESKGCELTLAAHALLKEAGAVNYIGSIEGRDISTGRADVIICDGFVGNIILKFAEGLAEALFAQLKEEMGRNLRGIAGGWLLLPHLRSIVRRLDYTEYGGAPLLGVDGTCIIAHGSSNAKAILNAIRVAAQAVETSLTEKIRLRIQEMDGDTP
ncbi:MAG: phosphate acyltransferase PlsX [Firmicutes bacterium]|nr:phosphate acyltransferase PlsX [Bacillota bacterium]